MSQVLEKKKFSRINELNDLIGKEWMKYTKSWFILKPVSRKEKNLHPASFPEELASRFISFFTKKDGWVFDPFLGTGSTLLAASVLNRNGIGIELYENYYNMAIERVNSNKKENIFHIFNNDSRYLLNLFYENNLPEIDLCLTSPPYWNQLLYKNNKRNKNRDELNMSTNYGFDANDIGSIKNYEEFLIEQEDIFNQVFSVTKKGGYLVIVTNNLYKDGKIYPLAFDTFSTLSKKWHAKDEQIWCQNDKKLFPFGIFSTYVGNRCHHYCFIFQK